MPLLGTIIPCKDASFSFGGVQVALEDATLRGNRDLVDVSTNASAGCDELVACFRRFSLDCSMPWRVQGWEVADGDEVTFIATVIPVGVVITVTVMIESVELSYKAKDVWRAKVGAKSSGPVNFKLPGP
jgi:hypothetical protein